MDAVALGQGYRDADLDRVVVVVDGTAVGGATVDDGPATVNCGLQGRAF
jgi:hypothetical protein